MVSTATLCLLYGLSVLYVTLIGPCYLYCFDDDDYCMIIGSLWLYLCASQDYYSFCVYSSVWELLCLHITPIFLLEGVHTFTVAVLSGVYTYITTLVFYLALLVCAKECNVDQRSVR